LQHQIDAIAIAIVVVIVVVVVVVAVVITDGWGCSTSSCSNLVAISLEYWVCFDVLDELVDKVRHIDTDALLDSFVPGLNVGQVRCQHLVQCLKVLGTHVGRRLQFVRKEANQCW
jgi:hypothetical protein